MTTWSQTFAQANLSDIDGDLGFETANDGTTPLGSIDIVNTFASPAIDDAEVIATQTTNIPETHDQEIRVLFTSQMENPASGSRDNHITIGTYVPDGTGLIWGVGVRFTFDNNDVRTLELILSSTAGIGAAPDILLTKDVSTETLKADLQGLGDTDLLVLQEMRLIVTVVEGGLRMRGYINEDDDDQPDLEYIDFRDPFHFTGSTFGNWFFAFGESQAGDLKVAEIHARDYEERLPEVVQLQDRHTLGEIRANVLTRMDGSSTGTDRAGDTTFMNEIINSTVEEIISEVGDVAWFMQVVEELTFTPNVDRVVTLPSYVDRVFTIVDVEREFSAPWQFLGKLADEVVQIVFEKGYSATGRRLRVHYQMKYQRMDVDADQCPIPRRYTEAVVYGTIMRVAEFDTNDSLHQQTMGRFQQKLRQMRQDMNRLNRSTKVKLQARRRVVHIPFGKHLTTPITGF